MGWLGKLKKFASEWGSHLTFADYALGIGRWAWASIGTAVLGLLAAATPWLEAAGPFGWFLIGLAGTLLLACLAVPISALAAKAAHSFRLAQPASAPAAEATLNAKLPVLQPALVPDNLAPAVAEDPNAKHDLAILVADRLLPACDAQIALQNAIIDTAAAGSLWIAGWAKRGRDLDGPAPKFLSARKELKRIIGDVEGVKLGELVNAVHLLENESYSGFCSLSTTYIERRPIDLKTDHSIRNLYIKWRDLSIDLEKDFDPIWRDARYPKLRNLMPRRTGRRFAAHFLNEDLL